jgi:DNA-binding PadR family transcriptional regulator
MSRVNQFSEAGLALTPPVFYILLTLSVQERHGYEILKRAQAESGGSVRLGPGTLYTSLKRLLREGLITEAPGRPDGEHDDERRRYYRLTERGRGRLGAEVRRMERALALAYEARLGPVGLGDPSPNVP